MDTTTKPAIGTTYRTGDISPVSGQYACTKCEEKGASHVVFVQQNATFPKCDQCKEDVTWRLESYS